MASPEGRHARYRASLTSGRIAGLVGGITRSRSWFRGITRAVGVGISVFEAVREVRRKLDSYRRLLRLRPGSHDRAEYAPPPTLDPYVAWLRVNRDNPRRRSRLDATRKPAGAVPRFSVVAPVDNPSVDALRAMIRSVVAQTVDDWELVLIDEANLDAPVRQELCEWTSRDARIRIVERRRNGSTSAATDDAIAAARGEFLVLLGHDGLLHPDALAYLSLYLDEHPETDLVYSDDDEIDGDGRRHSPRFKPDWSPELLLSFYYTGLLTAVRRRLYHEVGGMRAGFEGLQHHDFWLRASEVARRIGHVPQVLHHSCIPPGSIAPSGHSTPAGFEAGRLAVEEAFHRRGVACRVQQAEWADGVGCAIYEPVMPDDGPSVAILIPSRNHGPRLKIAVDSLAQTTYRNYRIYVLDNDSDDPATLEYLAALPHRVFRIPHRNGRFSFAAINNTAAAMVDEDLLLFLNDDTEVINPRWLSQMVGWSRLEGVGAVGARLLFPDGRIQHAGIVHEFYERTCGHAFRLLPRSESGTFHLARVSRNCLAVTAACMLTPRRLFLQSGGFDEERFAVAYNDGDYGYRLSDAGYRSVYCAEAELYHHEGLSRGRGDDPREIAAFRAAHTHRPDRYFSPHFDPDSEMFQVKPTVVPMGARSGPIPLLAVTRDLSGEGASRIEFELVRRLQASGALRAEVLSPCEGPLRRAYEQEGIPIRVEPALAELVSSGRHYGDGTSLLADWLCRQGFEVVHANSLRTFWAIEAARLAGVPSVWSVDECEPWQATFDDLPTDVAASALGCLAYPYRVVFSSRSSMWVWKELNTSGNFELIRLAHDVPQLLRGLEQISRGRARQELGLGEDELGVLLMGTVCERKGQLDLLEAFASLPVPVAARMKCYVVGARDDEVYSRRFVELAQALPPDRRERFVVVPETGETSAHWKAADVLCCTSRVEGYPLVTLQAMAVGLPIVTTPVYGIAEQVRPWINALTYHPGDIATLAGHLVTLAESEALRRSMADASPQVLRCLPDDSRMIEQYRQTFLAAAQSSPLFPEAPGELDWRRGALTRGRRWFADSRRPRAGTPPHLRAIVPTAK
jgi:O-antigen biosynthesis protein